MCEPCLDDAMGNDDSSTDNSQRRLFTNFDFRFCVVTAYLPVFLSL